MKSFALLFSRLIDSRSVIQVLLLGAVLLQGAVNASAAGGLPDFTALVEKNSPAVVKISTVERGRKHSGRRIPMPNNQDIPDIFRYLFEPRNIPERNVHSMGSGFIISSDGYILTNNHVIDDADEIIVRLIDRREFEAEVVGRDERSDLALLKVKASKLPVLKFSEPDELKVGEWVLAIGSPFGLEFSASVGIVSAIGRSIPTEKNENYVPFIQTDVAINPGNSGGPLFNLDGEVVGINSQIYTRSGGSIGLSFAIPVSVALEVVEQLKSKGRVDRGWLGVTIQEVDRNLADSFGLDKPMGALIAQVEPGSPAYNSGLKAGDIIVKFDGMEIRVSGDLPHAVGRVTPGKAVPVKLIREGKATKLNVKVGALGDISGEPEKLSQSPTEAGGRLGLVVESVNPRLKKAWSLSGGVVVKQVRPDSPGAVAGLHPGDVIAELGFKEVSSLDVYLQVESDLPANKLMPLRFFRQGRPTFRTVIIKE